MKRSNLFANVGVIALAALMTTWFGVRVAGIQGGHPPCLKDCGKNEKPPGCCEEPKCDFNRALLQAVISYRIGLSANYSKKVLQGPMRGQNMVNQFQEFSKANAAYHKAAAEEINKFAEACPDFVAPTRFHLTRSCDIVTPNSKAVESVDEAMANSPDCPEIAAAEYEAARMEQNFCYLQRTKPQQLSVSQQLSIDRLKDISRVDSLTDAFERFWVSCLEFWDPQRLSGIMSAFNSALTPPMPSKPAPRSAKRAGGGR